MDTKNTTQRIIIEKTTEAKHTALPWKMVETSVKNCPLVVAGDGTHDGFSLQLNSRANAAFIVRACNNHVQLLEACKLAYEKTHDPVIERILKPVIELAERGEEGGI